MTRYMVVTANSDLVPGTILDDDRGDSLTISGLRESGVTLATLPHEFLESVGAIARVIGKSRGYAVAEGLMMVGWTVYVPGPLLPSPGLIGETVMVTDGSKPMTGNLSMGGFKITNLSQPTDPTDAQWHGDTRVTVDADVQALSTDRFLGLTGLTMDRTVTLVTPTDDPPKPVVGHVLTIKDVDGTCSPGSRIGISGAGINIDGNATVYLTTAFSFMTVEYVGGGWSIIAQG